MRVRRRALGSHGLVYHHLQLLHFELLAVAGHDRPCGYDIRLRIVVALCAVSPERPSLVTLFVRFLSMVFLWRGRSVLRNQTLFL